METPTSTEKKKEQGSLKWLEIFNCLSGILFLSLGYWILSKEISSPSPHSLATTRAIGALVIFGAWNLATVIVERFVKKLSLGERQRSIRMASLFNTVIYMVGFPFVFISLWT